MAKEKYKFPRSFWIANFTELFERAAYYGMFISITLYLTKVGFNDIEGSILAGIFGAGIYFFPTFTGAYSDKIGYKKSLILAFSLLTIGYLILAVFPEKFPVIIGYLVFLMFGASFIKSVITGTVAKSSTEKNRAKAFSIFYSMVNVGAFSGKLLANPVRTGIDLGPLGEYALGIEYIGFYSASMTLIALVLVILFFKNVDTEGMGRQFSEIWESFIKVITNFRLILLIIIVSGFWLIQHQMYASMPKYITRTVGEHAAVEWYANVNPAMVMIFVMLVTKWMKKKRAVTSMTWGMFIMPLSVFFMSAGPLLQSWTGDSISFGITSMHPFAVMMVLGIAFQGFAECFISPRFLEYFSKQAPKGEEGLYLGFSHLHSVIAYLVGFVASGVLLDFFCPDPNKPEFANYTAEQMNALYDNAHYIWYVFAAIGFLSALSLYAYRKYYDKKDAMELTVK